jgi:NAD+ synthase
VFPEKRVNPGPLIEQIADAATARRADGCAVAVSGGVDSAVVASLAVQAVGAGNVRALHLPDVDSDPASRVLAEHLCDKLGVEVQVHDITAALSASGCYEGRDAVVRRYVPDYDFSGGWTFKLVIRGRLTERRFPVNMLVVIDPSGTQVDSRLRLADYRALIGLTNMKQRYRMLLTYRLAETENLVVLGTSNKLEVEQGFFVDHGDGTGHFLPLRHLYKSEVFDLAEQLAVPEEITARTPTTDTFSASQSQTDFFFGLPHVQVDQAWSSFVAGDSPEAVASTLGLTVEETAAVFVHFRRRRKRALRLGADVLQLGE